MSHRSRNVMTRVLAGLIVALVVMVFLMNWALGLLMLCMLAAMVAFINLRKPMLLDPLRIKRKVDPEDLLPEKSHVTLLSDNFVPTIKLTCRDSPIPIEFTVDEPDFTIGRSNNCSYQLDFSKMISNHHCTIKYDQKDMKYTLTDNKSKHGTKLNGVDLTPKLPMELRMNDEIMILHYRFHVIPISSH